MANNKLKGAGGVAFKLPSGDLPPVTPGDEGKYLGINEGGVVSWLNFSSQVLPAIVAGDDGKHLEVVDGKPAWTVPTGSLPKVTTTDSGKVMIVSTSGIWACDYLSLASVSGKLEIAHGGTGATTLEQAQENLGILPFPEPEVTDAGKVYGVDENGDIVLDYPPQEVPEPTATDVDKYISVKGANEYELKALPAKQLPVPTASDVNKVPVVKGANEYELKELEDKVPTPTAADKDKVLRAQADGTYALTDETQEVPVPAATDKDKVLAATANGDYNLVEPSGGLPTVTAADDGKAMLVTGGKWGASVLPKQLPVPTVADKDKIPVAQTDGTYVLKAQKEELPQSTSADANKALTVNAAGKPEWKMLASDATPVKKTLTTMDAASSHFSGGNVTLTMSGNVGVLRFEEVYFSASTLTFAADGRCTISFTVPLGSCGYKFADGCSINCGATKLADVKHGESYSLMGYKLGVTGAPGMTAFNCELTFYKPDYALGSTDIVRLGDEVCVVLEKEGA